MAFCPACGWFTGGSSKLSLACGLRYELKGLLPIALWPRCARAQTAASSEALSPKGALGWSCGGCFTALLFSFHSLCLPAPTDQQQRMGFLWDHEVSFHLLFNVFLPNLKSQRESADSRAIQQQLGPEMRTESPCSLINPVAPWKIQVTGFTDTGTEGVLLPIKTSQWLVLIANQRK